MGNKTELINVCRVGAYCTPIHNFLVRFVTSLGLMLENLAIPIPEFELALKHSDFVTLVSTESLQAIAVLLSSV